jgi:glycosyltransferase involved in cell wall biosynthesis
MEEEVIVPRVSIIIPLFNAAQTLKRCIDSVISQDITDWELILIDDGSTDKSGCICDDYAQNDTRIHVFHKVNEGVSMARNLGIQMARANNICFIDSDDWVEKDYLSSLLEQLTSIDTLSYCDVMHEYEDGRPSKVAFNYFDETCVGGSGMTEFITRWRLLENGYPIGKIFNKGIIDRFNLKFNPAISLHEDHLFVLNYMFYVRSIALIGKPTYHYVHGANQTSLSRKRHPAKCLVAASDDFLTSVGRLIDRFDISDKAYIKRTYTLLGLNQLVRAALTMDREDMEYVGDRIRMRKNYFKFWYTPNHKIVKLIPFLFFIKQDRWVWWLNKWIKFRNNKH